MSTSRAESGQRTARWDLILILGVTGLLAAWFVQQNVLRYLHYDAGAYGHYYWPRRGALVPHIAGGLTAVVSGLVQLWLGLTGRIGALHRALGKVYAAAIAVASTAAIYLALSAAASDFAYGAGLFFLGVAWIITTSMAIISIRRRSLEQHREWMIRSYVVTFAFVSFRLGERVLVKFGFAPVEQIEAFLGSACWAVPLLFTEPLIQWRRLSRR